MSAFHLRDSLTEPGFTNRVDSVFAALGSGSVKAPEGAGSSIDRNQTPSFDQDQFNRSIKSKESNPKRRKYETDLDFKHPAEFLRPESRERSPRAGIAVENVARGRDQREGRGSSYRGGNRGGNRGGRGGERGHIPDYKKNPENWTKYSLADAEKVTDRSNTAAAFQFLKSIKTGNKSDSDNEEASSMDTSEKLVFKKPNRKKGESNSKSSEAKNDADISMNDEDDSADPAEASAVDTEISKESKAKFVGSKNVMPECVVGAKPTNKDKKVKEKSKMKDKLVLSHLQDEEEDE